MCLPSLLIGFIGLLEYNPFQYLYLKKINLKMHPRNFISHLIKSEKIEVITCKDNFIF